MKKIIRKVAAIFDGLSSTPYSSNPSSLFYSASQSTESFVEGPRSLGYASVAVALAPVAFGYMILDKISPALADAITKKLGSNFAAQPEEEIMDRALIVGNYYNDTEGAIALAQQQQEERHKAQALIEKVAKKLAEDFRNAETLKEIPDDFLCPITLSIMVDPVKVTTALDENNIESTKIEHYFDKDAIEDWINTQIGERTNPLNRLPILMIERDAEFKEKIQAYINDPKNHNEKPNVLDAEEADTLSTGSTSPRLQ